MEAGEERRRRRRAETDEGKRPEGGRGSQEAGAGAPRWRGWRRLDGSSHSPGAGSVSRGPALVTSLRPRCLHGSAVRGRHQLATRLAPRGRASKMAALALRGLGLRRKPVQLLLLRRAEEPLGAPEAPRMAQSQASMEPSSAHPNYPGIVESTEEYKYVERLIPPTRVPAPPKHNTYPTPSGWRPPQDPPPDLPFFVRRSRMHNIPVYTDTTHGCRKMTVIRKIEGDIWALEKEVKEFLTQLSGQTPPTQVNEVACSIRIKGYFDQELKTWLMDKGF